VLSGRGLCDELIARPEESYRLWCVVVCDLETSRIGASYIYNVRLLRIKRNVPMSVNFYINHGIRKNLQLLCRKILDIHVTLFIYFSL
jgi:hypothetical protein